MFVCMYISKWHNCNVSSYARQWEKSVMSQCYWNNTFLIHLVLITTGLFWLFTMINTISFGMNFDSLLTFPSVLLLKIAVIFLKNHATDFKSHKLEEETFTHIQWTKIKWTHWPNVLQEPERKILGEGEVTSKTYFPENMFFYLRSRGQIKAYISCSLLLLENSFIPLKMASKFKFCIPLYLSNGN